MSSIFATYSMGENRVTASILAVIRSLSLDRIQRLLGALLEASEFELVRFQNQPSQGGTVPDAVIVANVRLLIETKIKQNQIDIVQLTGHLDQLDREPEAKKLLLVITPDAGRPSILDSLEPRRVIWASFAALDQAIDELLDDEYEVVSEREAFLLRELQNMLMAEGLIASENDVVVVAARYAWPEYNHVHAYICQPRRPFQPVSRVAFYSKGYINPLVPKILESHDYVLMVAGQQGTLGHLVDRLLKEKRVDEGDRNKVLILSAPDSQDTIRLPSPIPNDAKAKTGKPTAFTMSQRYVTSERLKAARTTGDLV